MKVQCGKCKARINLKITEKKSDEIFFSCPVCKTKNKLILKDSKNDLMDDRTKIESLSDFENIVGWLVVHDENTKQQTHNLKMGKNIVGRKSDSKPCDVMIETNDNYMSRNHFAIEVSRGINGLDYLVYDVTSTNGTYINANANKKLNINDKVYLGEGDTIQAGRTKMVLQTKKVAGTARNATDTVIRTTPLKTIIVG